MKKRIGARKEKSDCEPEELCFLAKEFDELTEKDQSVKAFAWRPYRSGPTPSHSEQDSETLQGR